MNFIDIFNHFNLYAMSKNVFFRGGISQGELFKKENYQFFGDSVIGTYLLESNISKFPIITIDKNTYNDLKAIKDLNNMMIIMRMRLAPALRAFFGIKNQVLFSNLIR